MAKRTVLDVGNCGPDHASIKKFITSNFDAELLQTHGPADTLPMLRQREIDLVLINRKLDQDYTDGVEILKQIKADEQLRHIPVMIITNHAEHQDAAVELGAERGFGKLELRDPTTIQRVSSILA